MIRFESFGSIHNGKVIRFYKPVLTVEASTYVDGKVLGQQDNQLLVQVDAGDKYLIHRSLLHGWIAGQLVR